MTKSPQVLIHKPNIWFTSDYHLFHDSPEKTCGSCKGVGKVRMPDLIFGGMKPEETCRVCDGKGRKRGSILTLGNGRPFGSIEEHNEAILQRHNECVAPGDVVYNLGDLALKTDAKTALAFWRRFHGNQYFVWGNHDKIAKEMLRIDPKCFVWAEKHETIKPKIDGIPPITLCHYAMRTWPGSHKGRWQLYGHSHGMLPELPSLLAFDVGVDCWDFRPVSIEQVAEKMKSKMPEWEKYKESLRGSSRAE